MFIKNYLFLLPFIFFAGGYFVSSLLVQQSAIVAPSLIGLSIAQACALTSRHDLTIKLLGDTQDADVLPGTIIRQTPLPGHMIKPYQSIHVVISKQPAPPRASRMIGMHKSRLAAHAQHAQIKIYEVPSIHPTGICFAQTPPPDEPVINNKIITYVSAGNAKPIIWPCLTGQLVQDVLALLEMHAITIDLIHTHPQPHYHRCQDCRVVDQNPRAGSLLILDSHNPISIQLQVE